MPQHNPTRGTVFEGIRPFEVHYDDLNALYEYLDGVFQYLLINETNQEDRPELKRFVLSLIAFHTRVMDEILSPLDNRIAEYNQKRKEQEQLLAEQEQLRQQMRLLEEQMQQITHETQSQLQSVARKLSDDEEDDFSMPAGAGGPFAMDSPATRNGGSEVDPFADTPKSSNPSLIDWDVPEDVKDMLVETEMPDDDELFAPNEFDLPIHDRNDSRGLGFADDYDDPMRPGSSFSPAEHEEREEETGMTGEMVNMLDNLEDHDDEIEREAEFEVNAFDPENLFGIDNVDTFDDLTGTTDTFRPIYGNERRESRDSDRQQDRGGRGNDSFQDDNDVGFIFDDLDGGM